MAKRRRWLTVAAALAGAPFSIDAQAITGIGPDSVTTVAAKGFDGSGFYRSLVGENYREFWTLPIRVPVLHITQLDGGITPYRTSGGKQTRGLRLLAADSAEWSFRPVYKNPNLPEEFRGTLTWKVFNDMGSTSHPAATVVPVPIMDSFGLLNPQPILVFLPDDPALGEFRKEFGGVLGTIERYPTVPKVGRAFVNAKDILDEEALLEAINKSPETQVDARTLLKVRLIDLVLGDNDRHAGQWMWAQLTEGGAYAPIARDRDKVFVSFEGLAGTIGRMVVPSLVKFDTAYARPSALFDNAMNFDRRILGGLDKSVWESTAREIQSALTNELLDRAIASMPVEYASRSAEITSTLRYRRDHLAQVAMDYYNTLFIVADAHGTDANDVATITRQPNGSVDVAIQAEGGSPWFQRHYDAGDTREIRLYLHDGDDRATVTGASQVSIPVRVIGGNGTNTLVDESTVGGRRNTTRLYDQGTVTGVTYGRDPEVARWSEVDALDELYNRRPFVKALGRMMPPKEDFGATIKPVFGLKTGHGLGLVPKVGIARTTYGFRKQPYASRLQADVGYSTKRKGWVADLLGDWRFESSYLHAGFAAALSQIEVIQFRGFGNDIEEDDDPFFDVKQTMYSFRPSLGLSFAPKGDISIGPIIRQNKTDSTSNNFISLTRPVGFSNFKQAGASVELDYDSHWRGDTAIVRFTLEGIGAVYPKALDVDEMYQSVEGTAATYITIPALTNPVIALRAGGKKLFGDFPYFDAAFIGGGSSYRTEHRQRYAGDASAFGTAELRVPLFTMKLIVPTGVGAIGFADAARVYLDGESPGGWHTAFGGGGWISAWKPEWNVNVLYTTNENRRISVSLGYAF